MTWLACAASTVKAINASLPNGIRVAPTADVNGNLWLGAYLLTDCKSGQTYGKAQSLIESLTPGTPARFPVDNSGI